MSYQNLIDYMEKLKIQTWTNSLRIPGYIKWDVFDVEQIKVVSHKNEAGLQLADVVAGSFYEAVSVERQRGCFADHAKLIVPRLYRGKKGVIIGNGIKPMPALDKMGLLPQQREIFEFMGYARRKW
ncbi:MAG: DUF3800 domain-containing protein [Azospirillaceae bacterium]|nr:DUF3800 domain-containing protein [Azospirillaceae bacterium]